VPWRVSKSLHRIHFNPVSDAAHLAPPDRGCSSQSDPSRSWPSSSLSLAGRLDAKPKGAITIGARELEGRRARKHRALKIPSQGPKASLPLVLSLPEAFLTKAGRVIVGFALLTMVLAVARRRGSFWRKPYTQSYHLTIPRQPLGRPRS